MRLLATTALACALLATPLAAEELRLPPSVGATPIEIPYIDPDAPLVMDPNAPGRVQDIQPLPLPGTGLVGVLPVPMPSTGITQIDPRQMPGAFSATPIEIPRIARIALEGRFSYAVLPDGTIYGDTNFGYARFRNMNDYRAFLRSH